MLIISCYKSLLITCNEHCGILWIIVACSKLSQICISWSWTITIYNSLMIICKFSELAILSPGYMMMTDDWFSEYVFEVVVDKSLVSEEIQNILKQEPIVLPAWDPMGALAKEFSSQLWCYEYVGILYLEHWLQPKMFLCCLCKYCLCNKSIKKEQNKSITGNLKFSIENWCYKFAYRTDIKAQQMVSVAIYWFEYESYRHVNICIAIPDLMSQLYTYDQNKFPVLNYGNSIGNYKNATQDMLNASLFC